MGEGADAVGPVGAADEHAANLRKLQALLPAVAHVLAPQFGSPQVQAWQGSRCVSHDRASWPRTQAQSRLRAHSCFISYAGMHVRAP